MAGRPRSGGSLRQSRREGGPGMGEMPISISSSPQEAAVAICQWEQRQRGQQMAENIIIYCAGTSLCWQVARPCVGTCVQGPPGCQERGWSRRVKSLWGLAVRKETPGNVQQDHKGEQ